VLRSLLYIGIWRYIMLKVVHTVHFLQRIFIFQKKNALFD
jgi:hypothetical protein